MDMLYRNRGTECMRSPEMLLATSSPGTPKPGQVGSQKHTANDVWALGCLLYELATGAALFPNELDWPKFFITVTDPTQVSAATLHAALSDPIQLGQLLCQCQNHNLLVVYTPC